MSIINTPRLYNLWLDAQNKPEWATTRLWEYMFKEFIFTGPDWAISSQQPPTDDPADLRRVDLTAEHSDRNGKWTRVLFKEAKSASATPGDLHSVEAQAFTACCAYLHYFQKNRVYAMTCFAGKVRIWAYERGHDYLIPYLPNTLGLGAKDEYIEAHSNNGHLILEHLKFIRDNHVPPSLILKSQSSPRPTTLILPPGWHDNEVAWVAGPSASWTGSVSQVEYSQQTAVWGAGPSRTGTAPTTDHSDLSGANTNEQGPPQFVETWLESTSKGQVYRFRRHDGGMIETEGSDWKAGEILYDGKSEGCSIYTGKKSGQQYYTWNLGSLPADPKDKGKGKGKGTY